jgi:hypothetical protein
MPWGILSVQDVVADMIIEIRGRTVFLRISPSCGPLLNQFDSRI